MPENFSHKLTHCKMKQNAGHDSVLSPRQKRRKWLRQFSNLLKGLEAKQEFGWQTRRLLYAIFILKVNNIGVLKRFRTETKGKPEEAKNIAFF